MPYLKRIIEGRETLSRHEASELMHQVFSGKLNDFELAALLGAISARGETSAELAGFVDTMRAAAVQVPLEDSERELLIDTCGTGGDASGTFNISTAAALVAAAAQPASGQRILVAKHGNRAVTSKCGSADVLEALGVPVMLSPEAAAAALRSHHFAFLHAPSLHPSLKPIMPVRRALRVRTVFNILGPLTNPAGARAQVMGVYAAHLVPTVAEAMRLLGVRHAFVVHGDSHASGQQAGPGLDEISISGASQLAEVRGDSVTFFALTPEQVGLTTAPIESLTGGDAAINAHILRGIFAGEPGPRRDVVLLNAAAVLITSPAVAVPPGDPLAAFHAGIELAARTIDSGAVTALVAELAAMEP